MADMNMYPVPDGAGKKIHASLYQTTRKALAFTTGVTTLNFTIETWANLTRVIFEMPAFSGAVVTGTLSIENQDDIEIYTYGSVAESATYTATVAVPLVGINTVKVTLYKRLGVKI